jgi:hypothetical protein
MHARAVAKWQRRLGSESRQTNQMQAGGVHTDRMTSASLERAGGSSMFGLRLR